MNRRRAVPAAVLPLLAGALLLGGPARAQPPTPVGVHGPGPKAPGQLLEAIVLARWSAVEVQRRAADSFGAYGPPLAENAVDLWRLSFVTTGLDGQPTSIRAQAFTPVDPSRGAAPLLVFGAGTTGVGSACAPSSEIQHPNSLGSYPELMAALASRGLAVVLPDYLGFDDPERPQAYFVAEAEAHVMLDAARAGVALYEANPGIGRLRTDVVMAGYSQGGHAAFAAADRLLSYAPDVPLRGVIGYAATTDVTALLATAAYYAPYVLVAYRSAYGDAIDPSQVLAARFASTLEETAGSVCVDRAQQIYPYRGVEAYTPAFHLALQAGSAEDVAPAFARALAANAAGLSGHALPALLIQGGQDVIVSDATQERFAAALCAAGSAVHYVHVARARHRDTRAAGFEPTLAWIWGLMGGRPAPSTCGP